ncbi:MAG: phosphatase [Agathobacter sp.]|nr:phosphatase [Agathobacter sp.]
MHQFDPHIHTISSGHGTNCTITDIAKCAAAQGLQMVGITDHGPATLGAGRVSYFRNLAHAPKTRCGVEILYGVEANILDQKGTLDLADEILELLDYAIISMHKPIYQSGTPEENTFAYINTMKHPKVLILGHCDDVKFPVDYEALVVAAKHYGVLLEINNASLSPEGYRGDVRDNIKSILAACKKHNHPIVLSSDSHGLAHVGDFQYALAILQECNFPAELILNVSVNKFKSYLKK